MTQLQSIELATGADPVGSVIWLHGLGADGWDFVPIVRELPLPEELQLRFVFPHAPTRPVTINNGLEMRAWYDIKQSDIARVPDERGIRESQASVESLIAREKARGIAAGRIVLAGFSQGGAIALQTALRYPKRLAGVMALSTYLPIAATLAGERSEANAQIPIFMAHGQYDDIIPVQRAQQSRAALEKLNYGIEWHDYPMPHSVCGEEVRDIAAWLSRLL
jgi:phospholipase/carboxylesterase